MDKKLVLLVGTVCALYVLIVVFGPPVALDSQFYYTGEKGRSILNSYTEAQWKAYLRIELIDLVLIPTYTVTLLYFLKKLEVKSSVVLSLPVLAAVCDLIETLTVIGILKFSVSTLPLDWLGVFTCSKWSISGLSVALIFLRWLARLSGLDGALIMKK